MKTLLFYFNVIFQAAPEVCVVLALDDVLNLVWYIAEKVYSSEAFKEINAADLCLAYSVDVFEE